MTSDNIQHIKPEQLADWLNTQTEAVVILDLREPAELQQAKVPPAFLQRFNVTLVNIPAEQLPQRLDELDYDSTIACLCHLGVRSAAAAGFLVEHDFENVANIVGGIDAWAATLDPTIGRY